MQRVLLQWFSTLLCISTLLHQYISVKHCQHPYLFVTCGPVALTLNIVNFSLSSKVKIFLDGFCFPLALRLSCIVTQTRQAFTINYFVFPTPQVSQSVKVKKIKEEDDHHHANNRIDNIILIPSGRP
jgi:hypothetical protein